MRSRVHRWSERIVAFGGLGCWLITVYLGLAFAAALLTTLTLPSVIRIYAELALVIGAFVALAAHRWRPAAARAAHWMMIASTAVILGTCGELIDLPPHYDAFDHRSVHVEFADDGVAREAPKIRDLIDQVYARSGLPEPASPLRMRFVKGPSGLPLKLGDWHDARASGADIALTTEGGATRGASFLLEGSFLLTEALARRKQPDLQTGARDGFAYWTMLGIVPQPEWAAKYLDGTIPPPCADLSLGLALRQVQELTIYLPGSQQVLHLDAAPFAAVEHSGGVEAARALFASAGSLDASGWLALVKQHCKP